MHGRDPSALNCMKIVQFPSAKPPISISVIWVILEGKIFMCWALGWCSQVGKCDLPNSHPAGHQIRSFPVPILNTFDSLRWGMNRNAKPCPEVVHDGSFLWLWKDLFTLYKFSQDILPRFQRDSLQPRRSRRQGACIFLGFASAEIDTLMSRMCVSLWSDPAMSAARVGTTQLEECFEDNCVFSAVWWWCARSDDAAVDFWTVGTFVGKASATDCHCSEVQEIWPAIGLWYVWVCVCVCVCGCVSVRLNLQQSNKIQLEDDWRSHNSFTVKTIRSCGLWSQHGSGCCESAPPPTTPPPAPHALPPRRREESHRSQPDPLDL